MNLTHFLLSSTKYTIPAIIPSIFSYVIYKKTLKMQLYPLRLEIYKRLEKLIIGCCVDFEKISHSQMNEIRDISSEIQHLFPNNFWNLNSKKVICGVTKMKMAIAELLGKKPTGLPGEEKERAEKLHNAKMVLSYYLDGKNLAELFKGMNC